MIGKYTYGDIISAIQSLDLVATEPRINDLSKLSFEYPNMSLRMIIHRKTFWIEERNIERNKEKPKTSPTTIQSAMQRQAFDNGIANIDFE